jgi:hypothetical protein
MICLTVHTYKIVSVAIAFSCASKQTEKFYKNKFQQKKKLKAIGFRIRFCDKNIINKQCKGKDYCLKDLEKPKQPLEYYGRGH